MSSIPRVNLGADIDSKFSISGIDWVATTVPTTGRPSVVSMSIQGGAFDPVDAAVTNVIHFSLQNAPLTFGIVGQFRCSHCDRRSVAAPSNLYVGL